MDARGNRHAAAAGLVAVALLLVTGCQSPGTPAQAAAKAVEVKLPPADITIEPAAASTQVRPDAPVKVNVSNGRITNVVVADAKGRWIPGTRSPDGTIWTATGRLRFSANYSVQVSAVNDDGQVSSAQSTFTTLKPKARLTTSISPLNGQTVGIGMPIVVCLSRAAKNRAAVEAGLTVTSSKDIEGSWSWLSDQELHFRPREYWPAGSKVAVKVRLQDVDAGKGV